MKTQSAKAKGRRLQQWVRDKLIEELDVHPEDIESVSYTHLTLPTKRIV